MNLNLSVFLEKVFLEIIRKKRALPYGYLPYPFWSDLIKNYFLTRDYICHKSVELQGNLKHFKFKIVFLQFTTENMLEPS